MGSKRAVSDDALDRGRDLSGATKSIADSVSQAQSVASGQANAAMAASAPRAMSRDSLETLAFALASALFLYGVHGAFSFPANHDMAWLLYVAGRALDGATLYVDVIEINPPLIIFLSMVAELIARLTGIWNITVFRLLVLGLAATSLLLATPLLRELLGEGRRLARHALLLVVVVSFVALPGMEFGQREHLAMLLTLPYTLAVAARAQGLAVGGAVRCAVLGAMAGVGLALKPFFLSIWLALELFLAWRCGLRSLVRLEHVAVLAVFVAYAIGTLIATPEFVPFARRSYSSYSAFLQVSPWILLRQPVAWLAGIALVAATVVPGPPPSRALRWTLGLACAGFLAAVFLQSKGWEYHWLPVRALAWVLIAAAAVDLLPVLRRRAAYVAGGSRRSERSAAVPHAEAAATRSADTTHGRAGAQRAWRRGTPALALVGLAVVLFLAAHAPVRTSAARWNEMARIGYRLPEMIHLVEQHGDGGPIAVLSSNMHAAFPLVNYTGVPWGMRFHSLFLLLGFYAPTPQGTERFPYHRPDEMSEGERYLFEATISDLERSRPTLLIIDALPPGHVLHGFDYLEYFSQDARFRALLEAYRPLTRIEWYLVLKRRDDG